jgi:cobalt-zinc-cadmium efflux system protein
MHDHSHHHVHGSAHDAELRVHGRTSGRNAAARRALWWSLALNGGFLVVEAAAAWWTGSLALASDAIHMLGDVGSLVLALAAARLAATPWTAERTFGLVRAETLGAFVNGLLLVAAAGWIVVEAIERSLGPPVALPGWTVLVVGVLGLAVNVGSVVVLLRAEGAKDDLNVRGALLHMAADALGSVGAIVAAVAILAGYTEADLIVSLLIALLVGWGAVGLVRSAGRVLLQLPPKGLDMDGLRATLTELPEVVGVHELHVWSLDGSFGVLTAHLVVEEGADRHAVRDRVRALLLARHALRHVTLQVEVGDEADHDGAPHP